ncbi:NAD-dependent epimerase/dehydratase family protein [Histidinibacterium aquaticum]|nr:NAD-dependent epimerase/dehydratase family protein [Histidinibacterium aquaticum]
MSANTETWLFLGATGRIGRMVLRHWSAVPPGARLVPQSRAAGEGLLQWDPLDPAVPVQAEVIFAFAGVTRSGEGARLNVDLGEAAVAMARHCGVRRVLLASSSAVYGPGAQMSEETPCKPVNDYGAAKLAMERAVAGAEVETCCLRIGNVAWADALLGRMGEGNAVTLDRFDDGEGPRRSYIGPRTLADVLVALARHPDPLPPVLNVALQRPVAMSGLLEAARQPWRWRPAPATAVQDVTLDCARLAALVDLPEGAAEPAALIAEGEGLKEPA